MAKATFHPRRIHFPMGLRNAGRARKCRIAPSSTKRTTGYEASPQRERAAGLEKQKYASAKALDNPSEAAIIRHGLLFPAAKGDSSARPGRKPSSTRRLKAAAATRMPMGSRGPFSKTRFPDMRALSAAERRTARQRLIPRSSGSRRVRREFAAMKRRKRPSPAPSAAILPRGPKGRPIAQAATAKTPARRAMAGASMSRGAATRTRGERKQRAKKTSGGIPTPRRPTAYVASMKPVTRERKMKASAVSRMRRRAADDSGIPIGRCPPSCDAPVLYP
jgi:hypothetical protein